MTTKMSRQYAHAVSDCIYDYGPISYIHSGYLLSNCRYNGILGNQPTNNCAIEMQLMTRFIKDNNHLQL